MRQLLSKDLGLRHSEYSFEDAIDCAAYGQWTAELAPLAAGREQGKAAVGNRSGRAWWVRGRSCTGDLAPPECVYDELAPCRHIRAGGTQCKYVCYTLSVAMALQRFLHSQRARMLLLEDDVCLTPALFDEAGKATLSQLAGATASWDMAKIGHCSPCDHQIDRTGAANGYAGCLAQPRGPDRIFAGTAPANRLSPDLGFSFCAHALGLTRVGARRLLRLIFPVTMIFDDTLMLLAGGFGTEARQIALRYLHLPDPSALRAVHVPIQLFAQWSRHPSPPAGLGVTFCKATASCDLANSSRTAPNMTCYALANPDLLLGYCGCSSRHCQMGKCNWQGLRRHYEQFGHGRPRACPGAAAGEAPEEKPPKKWTGEGWRHCELGGG